MAQLVQSWPSAAAERRREAERQQEHVLLEMERRRLRQWFQQRGRGDESGCLQGGLMSFIRYFWHVLEPATPFVDGWPLWAMAQHLEAVSSGELTRLLINVPPGFMKSLMVNVFWPAWEWGPLGRKHLRYVTFAYANHLTERDNGKFRMLLQSPEYQDLWPMELERTGDIKVQNSATGWKFASSVEGVGTGERGDRILLDDPVKVDEGKFVIEKTSRWFRTAMLNRLNDMVDSAIVIIMQRVHEVDVSGVVLEQVPDFVHLMVPMEYEPGRHCETELGWSDPRRQAGELAWPERFPAAAIAALKQGQGPTPYAAQYQQIPRPAEGAIFRSSWWRLWDRRDASGEVVVATDGLEMVVASLDGAFTSKEENDPSGLTVWGLMREKDEQGVWRRQIVLMQAWRKWLEFSGERAVVERRSGETLQQWRWRSRESWGLVEWVLDTCQRFAVDVLLIEAAASGRPAASELRSRLAQGQMGLQLVRPVGDKVSRALKVQHIFAQGMVWAPDREWAQQVIEEMEQFPRGRYDDLTDSTVQALAWMRDNRLVVLDAEQQQRARRQVEHQQKRAALYPC